MFSFERTSGKMISLYALSVGSYWWRQNVSLTGAAPAAGFGALAAGAAVAAGAAAAAGGADVAAPAAAGAAGAAVGFAAGALVGAGAVGALADWPHAMTSRPARPRAPRPSNARRESPHRDFVVSSVPIIPPWWPLARSPDDRPMRADDEDD